MKKLSIATLSTCLVIFAGAAGAQDAAKKDGATFKGGMMENPTMQQCKDHMAMTHKAGMKKSTASAMMDTKCADMMKTDTGAAAGNHTAMPASDMASAPMKK